jgi:hypothetical protein
MIAVSNFDHERQQKGDFLISTDVNQLDLDVIHGFLANAYWCQGISREIVARSIAHSLCFGLYEHHRQIGFARVISDFDVRVYSRCVYSERLSGTWTR